MGRDGPYPSNTLTPVSPRKTLKGLSLILFSEKMDFNFAFLRSRVLRLEDLLRPDSPPAERLLSSPFYISGLPFIKSRSFRGSYRCKGGKRNKLIYSVILKGVGDSMKDNLNK